MISQLREPRAEQLLPHLYSRSFELRYVRVRILGSSREIRFSSCLERMEEGRSINSDCETAVSRAEIVRARARGSSIGANHPHRREEESRPSAVERAGGAKKRPFVTPCPLGAGFSMTFSGRPVTRAPNTLHTFLAAGIPGMSGAGGSGFLDNQNPKASFAARARARTRNVYERVRVSSFRELVPRSRDSQPLLPSEKPRSRNCPLRRAGHCPPFKGGKLARTDWSVPFPRIERRAPLRARRNTCSVVRRGS